MVHSVAGLARAARSMAWLGLCVAFFGSPDRVYAAGANPGDPLFCQPNEGITFLIVNDGSGVFTSNADCYTANNIANDTDTTLSTMGGGTLTNTGGNYTYAPPTANFTGTDTFTIHVQRVWNSAGGPGSAGGTSVPGGPADLVITLNVIPAATTLSVPFNTATLVPIPAGSVSGCSPPGNSSAGPTAGAVYGCVTAIKAGSVAPSHGTLQVSGSTLRYTPTAGYSGPDTFSYQALGVNNDGNRALNSGDVTVSVTVGAPATIPTPSLGVLGMLLLAGALLLFGMKATRRQGSGEQPARLTKSFPH